MKKFDFLILILFIGIYITLLSTFKPQIFSYRFSQELMDRYFRSQDIPHEVEGRVFLSDADIYIATGYLYASGRNPAEFNFEHPPVIKYLYGFSIKLFNNPYFAQIMLGILLIITFYFFSKKITNSRSLAVISTLLLLFDPLFLDISSLTLLDLGQTLFLLWYFIAFFYFEKNFILQGIMLALFAGTKFWIPTFFFIFLFGIYRIYKKKMDYKIFVFHLITALIVYSFFYIQSFILTGGKFNIIWHLLKTVKYRLVHNTSLYFGASIIMFVTGYVKTWWGNQDIVRTSPWSILWPVTLIITTYKAYLQILKKKINPELIAGLIPLGYLCFLGVQAPFPRYFFIILPFLYISSTLYLFKKLPFLKGIFK